MSRLTFAALTLVLAAGTAFAADPKIDAAVKTFEQVAGDAAKLKTYCAMNALMNDVGDDDAKAQAAEPQMDGYMKELGPDLEAALAAGDGLDEKSPDLKAYDEAITKLDERCAPSKPAAADAPAPAAATPEAPAAAPAAPEAPAAAPAAPAAPAPATP